MKKPRRIFIVDYQAAWTRHFERLSTHLSSTLGELILHIEHVGSTSVPRLAAKPIIDMDIVIASIDVFERVSGKLAFLGYIHEGTRGIPERESFTRTSGDIPYPSAPKHNLYVCLRSSRELQRHLSFRDHLRANPEVARAYAKLKRQLAKRHPNDGEAYCDAKTHFIESILTELRDAR